MLLNFNRISQIVLNGDESFCGLLNRSWIIKHTTSSVLCPSLSYLHCLCRRLGLQRGRQLAAERRTRRHTRSRPASRDPRTLQGQDKVTQLTRRYTHSGPASRDPRTLQGQDKVTHLTRRHTRSRPASRDPRTMQGQDKVTQLTRRYTHSGQQAATHEPCKVKTRSHI